MRWILPGGFLGSLLLLLSGLVYARVPVGSSVAGFPLRGLRHDLALGLGCAVVGLVLLTFAWLALLRRVSGDPGGVRLVWWAAAAWTLPLLVAAPLFSNDGWSYVATGFLAGHGHSPYAVPPSVLPLPLRSGVDPVWLHTTSPYGPLPLLWGGFFSRLTSDPWFLLVANRLLAYAALVVLALSVPVLARRTGKDPARATALVLASPFVVAHGIGGLHNDLAVGALVAVAVVLTGPRRWWWGAMLVGLAASVKVTGLLAVVAVVLVSLVPGATPSARLRRTAQVGAVAVGTLVLASLLSGLGLGWVGALSRTAAERARLAPTALLGHWVVVGLAHLGPHGHALIRTWHPEAWIKKLGLVVLAIGSGVVLLRRRVSDHAAAVLGGGLVLLAATVLSPALHYWYFLWCLPLLACARLGRRAERTLVALLVALGLAAVADPAVHLHWLVSAALLLLVGAPLLTWLLEPYADRAFGRSEAVRRTLGRR